MSAVYIHDLTCVDPPFRMPQSDSLKWLREAYLRYQKNQIRSDEDYDRLLNRVAVSEKQIAQRFYHLTDFHLPPSEAEIFGEKETEGVSKRQSQFAKFTEQSFAEIYDNRSMPEHLIHVTCTGYGSPSAAQLLAAERSPSTVVTHSYHMGCYGAFPALRMASGFLSSSQLARSSAPKLSVDVVHTELCTLHLNPQDPTLEQIVIQSLFSDGVAAYRLSLEKPAAGFELLALSEFLLKNTSQAMQWTVSERGMQMSLSKDVPSLIANSLRETLENWEKEIQIPLRSLLRDSIVAVHPGGPKIIDLVKETLELSEEQVLTSRKILLEHGNMSSATLPHVWAEISKDPKAAGKFVISMAFGPGLTLALSLMRVIG
jgi:predicted naringenin-chalcone synthase